MYIATFGFRHTAPDAAAYTTFCMFNPADSACRILIRRIYWSVGFDGTAAASKGGYALSRYTVGATGQFTGGSSPARLKTDNRLSTSVIADANIKAGAVLTTTDGVFEGNFHQLIVSNQPASAHLVECIRFDDLPDVRTPGFVLEPAVGICARLALTAVIGIGCYGSIWWDEMPLTH
jgi:hypothetical protein